MEFQTLPEDRNLICLSCFNNATPINIPEQYLTVGAFCSQGHYRCIQCSYTALDIPSIYKDQTGRSYLSSNFASPQLRKCPKGHAITYSKKNILQLWEFQCFGCNQKVLFDDENGMGVC